MSRPSSMASSAVPFDRSTASAADTSGSRTINLMPPVALDSRKSVATRFSLSRYASIPSDSIFCRAMCASAGWSYDDTDTQRADFPRPPSALPSSASSSSLSLSSEALVIAERCYCKKERSVDPPINAPGTLGPQRSEVLLSLVVVQVVRLDVAAVVPAALRTHRVQDHADVLGLHLSQLLAHPQQQPAALRVRPDHRHHAVHARRHRDRLADDEERTGVEDDVIVLLQRPLDEVDQQLALEQFRRVHRLRAARHDRQVRHASLVH